MAENPIWLARPEPARAPAAPVPGRRLAVKDLFDTDDLPTTYGSPIFAGHRPARDAWSVALLREAGWEVVGKTNLHEFAYGTTSINPHFGTVRNPRDETRLAGGSSGGSAAAVAAGEADAALGTDSGGSIRIPAACCGIAGFKPTYGLVSADGVYPLAPSFDHVGPIAPGAAACASVMEDLLPGLDVPEVDLARLRCGVAWTEHTSPGVAAGVEAVAARFGARADPELAPPAAFGRTGFFPYEAALVHRRLLEERRADYGADVLLKLELGRDTPYTTYAEGRRAVARLRRDLAPVFAGRDVLLAPTLPSVAPPLDATDIGGVPVNDALASLTFPFNALGWPVAALPTLPAEDGLPGSVQVIGPPGADAFVLAVAIALERAAHG